MQRRAGDPVYSNWYANTTVAGATFAAVVLTVLLHYEGLVLVARGLGRMHARHQRIKVLYAIVGVLALHVIEIWIFAVSLWLLLMWPECGHIAHEPHPHFLDAVYLSAITYTTVGYGDVAPVGPIRLLAGMESLVGLVYITWSASFTYLEMERFWRRN